MAPDTIRVLLVEDDPTDAEFTRAMLAQIRHAQVVVRWVTTVADGLERLRSGDHDVALVDYHLGQDNGLDLIRRAAELELDTPMILLTGKGSREVDLEAQEAGAADYLVKGRIDPDGLERALRYTLDRTRALGELRESEARYRALFDHLPLGLYRCTPRGGFVDANPALVQLLGRPAPEVLRDRYASSFYVHPSDVARLRELLETDGVVRGFESWLERSDGFHVPVRNTARAHKDQSGRVVYVEGAVEDVRTVESVHRLHLGGARFRAAFESLGLPLAVTDLAGGVLDVSPSLAELFGQDPSALVTRPLDEFLGAQGAGRWRAALEAFLGGRPDPLAFEAVLPEGRRAAVVCAPVADEDGEPTEALVVFTPHPGP